MYEAATIATRRVTQVALGAVVVATLQFPRSALAQEEAQPTVSSEVSDATDGEAPAAQFEPAGVASKVESAVEKAREQTEGGVAPDYTIEFGDTDDWLQFKTGEWVRGDLHWVRARGLEAGEDVEFYSERLGDLTFSLGHVESMHCPNIMSYGFKGKINASGRGIVTKDKVIIETDEGVKTYPRSALVSIVEGEARERNWWSTKLSLGFSANAGNTNQGSLNTQWALLRFDGRTMAGVNYNGSVGYADDSINVNRHLVGFDVSLFLWGERFYVIPLIGQLLYDEFQNYRLRATPAAGGGVHVFAKRRRKRNHTNEFEWDLQSALGYQYASYFSTAAGVSNPQNDGFIMFRTFWKFEFVGDDVTIKIDWRTNLVYTTIGNTNHNGTAAVTVQITDRFDFEPSFLFLRTEDPLPKADGTVPKKNDYQLVVSLAISLG